MFCEQQTSLCWLRSSGRIVSVWCQCALQHTYIPSQLSCKTHLMFMPEVLVPVSLRLWSGFGVFTTLWPLFPSPKSSHEDQGLRAYPGWYRPRPNSIAMEQYRKCMSYILSQLYVNQLQKSGDDVAHGSAVLSTSNLLQIRTAYYAIASVSEPSPHRELPESLSTPILVIRLVRPSKSSRSQT